MTLIILEGPDGGGKSTLARRLVTLLGSRDDDQVELLHRGPPAPGLDTALTEYVEPLLDYRPGTGRHVVCDRWHVGEWVYPRLLGRPTTMDAATFTYVEAFLASRGALVVYVTPGRDVIVRNLAERAEAGHDDDRPTELTLPTVLNLFDEAWGRRHTTTWRLSHSFDPDVMAPMLLKTAWALDAYASRLNPYVTYVGPPQPDYLLVGDVRGPDGPGTTWPAFTPFRGTSGHFLMRAIQDATDRYRLVGMINANDVDDIGAFIAGLGHDQVVALGRAAHRTLSSLDVRHGAMPHPQYVRRFFHHHHVEYGEAITATLGTQADQLSWRPENTWLDETHPTPSRPDLFDRDLT